MPIKTVPFGSKTEISHSSDVASLNFAAGKLEVVVACNLTSNGDVSGLKFEFPKTTGFRYLDEQDLARYWVSDSFARGFHLLEVKEDGWLAEESQLQGIAVPRTEWLVVTGNACVSIFSNETPRVQSVLLPRSA